MLNNAGQATPEVPPTGGISQHGPQLTPESAPLVTGRSATLDGASMLALYEWLIRQRSVLFGDLQPDDRCDAINETFVQTVRFAEKLRNPAALRAACFTIGLRVRATRIRDYVYGRLNASILPGPVLFRSPEHHLLELERHESAWTAIRNLPASDREIIRRFYFEGQAPQQIQAEMHLTETQFRLRKSRAVKRVSLRVRNMLPA